MYVSSPCTKTCEVDRAAGICKGCFRTLGEIGAWTKASIEEKRKIVENAKHRKEVAHC